MHVCLDLKHYEKTKNNYGDKKEQQQKTEKSKTNYERKKETNNKKRLQIDFYLKSKTKHVVII